MCIFCSKGIICIRSCCTCTIKIIRKSYCISTNSNGNFICNLCCFRRIITDCMIRFIYFCRSKCHFCCAHLLCLEVQSKCVAELFFFTITSNPYNSIGRIIRNGISFTKRSCIQCQFLFIILKRYIHRIVSCCIIRGNLYSYRGRFTHLNCLSALKIHFIRCCSRCRSYRNTDRISRSYFICIYFYPCSIHNRFSFYFKRYIITG